jgi:DNA-directed RNA polymerase specialized sigma24 family protein
MSADTRSLPAALTVEDAYLRFAPAARKVVAFRLGPEYADDAVQAAAVYLLEHPKPRVTAAYFTRLAIHRAGNMLRTADRAARRAVLSL